VPRASAVPEPKKGSRLVLFLTVFIHLLGFGIIIPLLPYYAESYGASGLTVGLLTTSFSLMQFVFAPIWGRLSDRIGRRPVLIGSLILTSGSYVVFAVAGSLTMLFVSRMLAGIAGATISTAQAYVADTTTPAERTKGMGMIGAAFGMGFIFGPAIGGILSRWGYAVPAYAAAGLALVAAVLAFSQLPESLPPEARGVARAASRGLAPMLDALKRPVVGTVLGLFFTATACFAGMEAILALFCQRHYQWGPTAIGYLFAYVGIVSAFLQAGLVGKLAHRFGERALVRVGLALMGAAFVASGLAPPVPLFLLAMGGVALASGLTTPSLSSLVSVATPAEEQGGILGVYQSLGSLARSIGPFLGGFAFDRIAQGAPLWIAGLVLLGAGAAASALPARGRSAAGSAPA
jgi:multidrug resistance protein